MTQKQNLLTFGFVFICNCCDMKAFSGANFGAWKFFCSKKSSWKNLICVIWRLKKLAAQTISWYQPCINDLRCTLWEPSKNGNNFSFCALLATIVFIYFPIPAPHFVSNSLKKLLMWWFNRPVKQRVDFVKYIACENKFC